MNSLPLLCFVVPCYNEEDIINDTVALLEGKLRILKVSGVIDPASGVLFVDDGSSDNTWKLIEEAAAATDNIRGISLKKNYGQQTALYAGLTEAAKSFDVTISLDADGQHDPAAVDKMLKSYKKGNQVVCAVRKNSGSEGLLKSITSRLYYRILTARGVKLIKGHGDYRLASSTAIKRLQKKKTQALFLRSDFLKLRLKVSTVGYNCRKRMGGQSKYSFRKMLSLAAQGLAANGILTGLIKRDMTKYKVKKRTQAVHTQ